MGKKLKLGSFKSIFRGAVNDYVSRLKTIATFSGISLGVNVVIPAIIAFFAVLLAGVSVPSAVALAVIGLIFYFIAVNFVSGAFMYSQKDGARLKESFGFIKKNLWPLIGIALLIGLAVMGGFILLIIPGMIIAIYLSFSLYAFLDEGVKGLDALERSKEYVSGYFWPIVGRLSLYLLIVFAIGVFIGILGLINEILGDIMNTVFSYFILTPVSLCFGWRLYKDVKEKRNDVSSAPVSPKKAWLKVILVISAAVIIGAVIIIVAAVVPEIMQSFPKF